VVDFRPLLAELELKAPAVLRQVLLKRLMVRAAAIVAQRRKLKALASGEALGQVSSQTLPNLAVIERASELPLLRPLLTSGKDEILAWARKIGSFEASSRVPEHCFLGVKNPSTAATHAQVEAAEARLDAAVFEGVIHLAESFDLLAEIEEESPEEEGEVDLPPPNVPLFDLRSDSAFAAWHPPGALNLPYALALRAVVEGSFPALPAVALFCEIGYKSAHLAELLRARGVRACSLRGGAGPLRDKLADPLLLATLSPALLQG
jgi:thiamine biosynthesis protein ThiI